MVSGLNGKISGNISSATQPISGSVSGKGSMRGELSGLIPAVKDYEKLMNLPRIEGNVLIGDKTFMQLGLGEITPSDIDDMMINDLIGGN